MRDAEAILRQIKAMMEARLGQSLQKPGTLLNIYLLVSGGVPFKLKARIYKRKRHPKVPVTSEMIHRRFGMKV